uniref:Mucin-1 n=1 Tax=Panthera leo TaxID=9689 RepID=A0A8C8X6G0_PANLE
MTPRFLAPCFLLLLTGEGVEPVTSSNHKTSPQLSIRISFFFLSFSISNLQFNSCLEDPNTGYYQELQRNVSEWFLQVYNQEDFLGFSNIKFSRPGSVVVECTLAFRQGTTDALNVWTRLDEHRAEAARYGMSISSVRDRVSVPPEELRAAGPLSAPRCLSPYERVPHLPHPRALHPPWEYQTQPL